MADISFAFKIGGETIDPSEIKDEAVSTILESIVESVVDRIEDLECEEHKEAPRFLCTGEDFNDLSIQVFGCCDKLIKTVEEKLAI
jgi:hypothetical protein